MDDPYVTTLKNTNSDSVTTSLKDLVPQDNEDSNIPPDLLKTYYCGCGPVHPKWLQVFANKKFFTFLLSLYTLFEGAIIVGLTSVIISTVETRYRFTSTAAALMTSSFDFTVVLSIVFISYFGGKSHKPRWLGISLIILGIGALVFASPQFLFGRYEAGSTISEFSNEECNEALNVTSDCTAANSAAYSFLIIGQVIMGIGSAPLYTVATAYLDEIVHPKYVSLHVGAYLLPSIIGPVIGFGLASGSLSVYVDPWIDTHLEESDPTWVGAWWLGYIIIGVLSILLSIPFLMYPKWLPDSYLIREERAKEMAKIYPQKYANEDNLTIIVKLFPLQIKRLLTNPSFMFGSFALAVIFLVKEGVVTFGPKYVEVQFGVTPSVAGIIAGGIGISAAVLGVLTGIALLYLAKLKGRNVVVVFFIVSAIAIPGSTLFLINCSSDQVAGLSVPYPDGSMSGEDSSTCAAMCNCSSPIFEPVCGNDDITYFSPCRAGCSKRLENDEYIYENCTCIAESFINSSIILQDYDYDSINSTASDGRCPVKCNSLIFFILAMGFFIYIIFIIEIPYVYFTLRVVADDQRHLALGIQSAIYRLFGSVPGPLLFGAIIDVTCLSFKVECGRRGNCWVYDNDQLSLNGLALCLPCAAVATILFILAFLTYPKQNDKMDDDDVDIAVDVNVITMKTEANGDQKHTPDTPEIETTVFSN